VGEPIVFAYSKSTNDLQGFAYMIESSKMIGDMLFTSLSSCKEAQSKLIPLLYSVSSSNGSGFDFTA
jgi:hypothetical protein